MTNDTRRVVRTGPTKLCINIYDVRMESNLTLNVFCNKYKGHWPKEWTTLFPMVTQLPNIKLSPEKYDVLMWKRNDGILEKFTIRNAYQDLQSRQKNVRWKDLVWFSQNIPKHAFILWLAIKGSLTTQDKIRKWGSYDMMACPLCFK
ncbi:reverse transcriptase zinc-binding domain-containing protein, partial [Tanacetum coccineum]